MHLFRDTAGEGPPERESAALGVGARDGADRHEDALERRWRAGNYPSRLAASSPYPRPSLTPLCLGGGDG